MKRRLRLALVFLFLAVMVSRSVSAHDDGNVSYSYPWGNHFPITDDNGHAGPLTVQSNWCNSEELIGFSQIENSTRGMYDFPNGVKFARELCSEPEYPVADIALTYLDCPNWLATHPDDPTSDCDSPGTYGGENFHTLETESWCAMWGLPYPCGWSFTNIEINKTRWLGKVSRGETYWPARLLIHELGHAVGLNDYCLSVTAMNNGMPTCNGGAWSGVTSWTTIDKDGVFHSSHRTLHSH